MRRWLQYRLERILLRGAHWRLILLAGIVALVATLGGLAALSLAPGAELRGPGEAIWWAFLRLTDPGYLGDDDGAWRRAISIVLTLAGYVLFMGALIAVMTQALDHTIERLERGETPVALQGHLLVLGWTDRSAAIVGEFLLSERRVRRFLGRRGSDRLRVVLMVEDLDPSLQSEIATRFGPLWDEDAVILRSGTRLRIEHLERVAFSDAAAIVLPGSEEQEDFAGSDIAALKTLLSIASHPDLDEDGERSPPRVVAEIFDQRKASLADVAYRGELDVVPSDLHISRLIVQNVRSPGLSDVYGELLTHHGGATAFVPAVGDLAGLAWRDLWTRFDRAVPLGVVRSRDEGRGACHLCPPGDLVLEPGDRLVVVADRLEDATPGPASDPGPVRDVTVVPEASRTRRVLFLGWSDAFPVMVHEFATHAHERWELTVMSVVPGSERAEELAAYGVLPEQVSVRQVEGDFTLLEPLRAVGPAGFDSVVLLGSDWLKTDEEADARTLVGYLTLRAALRDVPSPPHVLVEITDAGNAHLFDERRGEVVVSPLVISHLLAHVTLRTEILDVFDTLFSAGGPSVVFRDPAAYGLSGEAEFATIRAATWRQGHAALGVRHRQRRRGRGQVDLVPAQATRFDLAVHDLVVLAPTEGAASG